MDVRIIVETTSETGEKRTEELRRLRLTDQCHSELRLKLEQGKTLLAQYRSDDTCRQPRFSQPQHQGDASDTPVCTACGLRR